MMAEAKQRDFGEKLRDVMVDEYLNANPDSSRPEVESRSVDGKVVCDTIIKSTRAISKKTRFQGSEEEEEFFQKQLEVSGTARYEACRQSIECSEGIIDSLFSSAHCDFSEEEKSENILFLQQNNQLAVDHGHAVEEAKKEIVAMMEGKVTQHTKLKLVPKRVRKDLVVYVKSLVSQMKTQAGLFKREYELGERFRTFTRDFIRDHLQSITGAAKKETIKTILRVYMAAKKESEGLPEPQTEKPKNLKVALAYIKNRMDKKRVLVETMERIVAYLEKMVEELENFQDDEGLKEGGPRMARSGRSEDRRGRR